MIYADIISDRYRYRPILKAAILVLYRKWKSCIGTPLAFTQKCYHTSDLSTSCSADPEEFLNILFHHILRVDPLLRLRYECKNCFWCIKTQKRHKCKVDISFNQAENMAGIVMQFTFHTSTTQNDTRAGLNLQCVGLHSHKVSVLLQRSGCTLTGRLWFNCRSFFGHIMKTASVVILFNDVWSSDEQN